MATNSNTKTVDSSIFDPQKHPLPQGLKGRMGLVSSSFFTARMRNLDMFEEKDRKMYGYMTYYDGNGFCWVQPMKTRNHEHDVEYDRYIKRINRAGRSGKLGYLDKGSIKKGMDVVAQYEVDGSWYRAMIVEELGDEQWMVLFIDFGNLQRSGVEEIKKPIHEKDCDHYFSALQAVCCRLYNIVPNSDNDRESIDMSLADFYARNTTTLLELYVRNIRPDYVVDCDLFLPKRGTVGENRLHHRHIGQFLVDQGLATFANPIDARFVKLAPTYSGDLITIDEDPEVKMGDTKSGNIKTENIKTENIKSENIKSENIKSEDIKSEQTKSEDMRPEVKFLSAPRVVQFSF